MFKKKSNPFKWPPELPSLKPNVRKKYEHHVIVSSKEREAPYDQLRDLALGVLANDEKSTKEFADFFVPEFQLNFTSEKAAKDAERAVKKATNNVSVTRERREVPVVTDEGVIL